MYKKLIIIKQDSKKQIIWYISALKVIFICNREIFMLHYKRLGLSW